MTITNLTVFNEGNTQEIILAGLVDQNNNLISAATISAFLARRGVTLTGSSLTFSPVAGTPGSYTATLQGFDAPPGAAELVVTGTNDGQSINLQVFCNIAIRSM